MGGLVDLDVSFVKVFTSGRSSGALMATAMTAFGEGKETPESIVRATAEYCMAAAMTDLKFSGSSCKNRWFLKMSLRQPEQMSLFRFPQTALPSPHSQIFVKGETVMLSRSFGDRSFHFSALAERTHAPRPAIAIFLVKEEQDWGSLILGV